MNNDENNVYLDLTNVHDGQYVTVDDNDGTIQIAQVQESSVNNSYNLNPVDIANITLDLSNNYDLLKTLVEEATKEKLDLSGLIMAWLKQYPDLSAALLKTKTDLDDSNKLIATYKSQVDELTDQNKELSMICKQKKRRISPQNQKMVLRRVFLKMIVKYRLIIIKHQRSRLMKCQIKTRM